MTAISDQGTRTASPLPDRSVIPPVWSRITNLVVDHGEGSWLVTHDGERYLDYTSGIGVTNTGHAHPRVVAAIQAQAAKLLQVSERWLYKYASRLPYAVRLSETVVRFSQNKIQAEIHRRLKMQN